MSLSDLQEPLALLEQEDYGAAIAMLEDTVAALPAHLGAHVLLAHAYESRERWEEALQSWAEARLLMPNSPIAETGTQRVLRRLEERDGDSFTFAFPPPLTPQSPSDTDADPGSDESPPTDEQGDDAPTDEDAGLAQLRRQAEREAQQGGARPDLSDSSSASDLSSSSDASPPTPEEQIEQLESNADDLDHLIDELQSARIDPEPDAESDAPPAEPNETDDAEDTDDEEEEIVSETLARIHEGQGDYREAARIYATLAEQEPDRAGEFQEKADQMREKADDTDGDG